MLIHISQQRDVNAAEANSDLALIALTQSGYFWCVRDMHRSVVCVWVCDVYIQSGIPSELAVAPKGNRKNVYYF